MLILLHHTKVIWHSLIWYDYEISKKKIELDLTAQPPVPGREDVPKRIVVKDLRAQGITTAD